MSEPPDPAAERRRRAVARFVGGVLVFAGGGIAGLAGLCTLAGMAFVGPFALAFGAVPVVVGIGLVLGGRFLRKRGEEPPRPVLPPAHFTENEP